MLLPNRQVHIWDRTSFAAFKTRTQRPTKLLVVYYDTYPMVLRKGDEQHFLYRGLKSLCLLGSLSFHKNRFRKGVSNAERSFVAALANHDTLSELSVEDPFKFRHFDKLLINTCLAKHLTVLHLSFVFPTQSAQTPTRGFSTLRRYSSRAAGRREQQEVYFCRIINALQFMDGLETLHIDGVPFEAQPYYCARLFQQARMIKHCRVVSKMTAKCAICLRRSLQDDRTKLTALDISWGAEMLLAKIVLAATEKAQGVKQLQGGRAPFSQWPVLDALENGYAKKIMKGILKVP